MKTKLILLLIILFPFLAIGQFQQQSENSLRVEGIFITKEKPEMIDFSIFIKNKSLDFKKCSDSLLIIIKDISDVLIKNGLIKEKIKISEISVDENYEYESSRRIKNGFIGSAIIEINDIFSSSFTELIFKSINAFNNEIEYSVKFSLSEIQKEKLRKLSLEKALEDANHKAEVIARIKNIDLVRINRITLDESSGFGFRGDQYDLVMDEEVFPMTSEDFFYRELNLNPKEISIVKSVLIEWIIKDKKKN
jgi:uncharacterized protein YggE